MSFLTDPTRAPWAPSDPAELRRDIEETRSELGRLGLQFVRGRRRR